MVHGATTLAIPGTADAVTPGWLTEALAGAFPGIEVTGARVVDVLHGSAAKLRVAIEATGAEGAPTSVLVKASFTEGLGEDDLARAWLPLMAMVNETEVRFYREDAAILGDRVPRAHAAAARGDASVLVLEDLNGRAGGVRFGRFDEPFSPDEMAGVLDVLARLHAHRWADRRLAEAPLRDTFLEGGMLDGFLSPVNWEQQMARPRGARVPEELRDHALVTGAIRRAWAAKREGPQCLVHGDPHIGNVFFDRDGAGLLDWQLACSGHWAADVVYALVGAMDVEQRRASERDLLRHYLERIAAATGAAPSFEDAFRDYRRFSIWGFAAFLTPGEGVQDEEYNATVGERHALAALDHDALALLG